MMPPEQCGLWRGQRWGVAFAKSWEIVPMYGWGGWGNGSVVVNKYWMMAAEKEINIDVSERHMVNDGICYRYYNDMMMNIMLRWNKKLNFALYHHQWGNGSAPIKNIFIWNFSLIIFITIITIMVGNGKKETHKSNKIRTWLPHKQA